jgi:hypothetical protein
MMRMQPSSANFADIEGKTRVGRGSCARNDFATCGPRLSSAPTTPAPPNRRKSPQNGFLPPARSASAIGRGRSDALVEHAHLGAMQGFFRLPPLAPRALSAEGVPTPSLTGRVSAKKESAVKPGSVVDSHSSGIRVAAQLKRPTRKPVCGPHTAAKSGCLPPYLVLLQVGFAVPLMLPPARCALTAPFHPYRCRLRGT